MSKKYGTSILHFVARSGQMKTIKFLQSQGVDVNAKTKDGWTALHSASHGGHFECVKFLQEHSADINSAKDKNGWTAFHSAARLGHIKTIKFLLESGRYRYKNSCHSAIMVTSIRIDLLIMFRINFLF